MTVYTKSYSPPPIDKKEILRYAGVGEPTAEILSLVNETLTELEGRLSYRACYCEIPVRVDGDGVDFGFTYVKSTSLSKNLFGCDSAILFAATLGLELDRMLHRLSASSPAKALILQSIGAERIEALCNAFNDEIKKNAALEHCSTRPRFSPGYGDFSIEFQRDIFRTLDCSRKIGLSLTESLLMSPSKSVSAIIGIEKTNDNPSGEKK